MGVPFQVGLTVFDQAKRKDVCLAPSGSIPNAKAKA